MARRNYIFDTIRQVYASYGFRQIETPALENLSTLMGKYGEEGDKLLFKILNSGDYLAGATPDELAERNSSKLLKKLSDKGLRYDLTVPFARFVVQYHDKLKFPFKRYQIQPVWRADRPQKGRYREFYQCDADIVGSDSLLNEMELVQIIDTVFTRLGVRVAIKINNRKVLAGIAELIGAPDLITDITVAIDKLDKIGLDNVNAELRSKGLSAEAVARLQPILRMDGDTDTQLAALSETLSASETGMKGVSELRELFGLLTAVNLNNRAELCLTLARGLNYYTGTILEVKALDAEMGSITGGGRYDNLTGIFGLEGVSGVGISFGADRIYDVLNQLDLYPKASMAGTRVIFLNFGDAETRAALPLIASLRAGGVPVELYPDAVKFKKQMAYADARGIPFVAIMGESEIAAGTVTLKDMATGEQCSLPQNELLEKVR